MKDLLPEFVSRSKVGKLLPVSGLVISLLYGLVSCEPVSTWVAYSRLVNGAGLAWEDVLKASAVLTYVYAGCDFFRSKIKR